MDQSASGDSERRFAVLHIHGSPPEAPAWRSMKIAADPNAAPDWVAAAARYAAWHGLSERYRMEFSDGQVLSLTMKEALALRS